MSDTLTARWDDIARRRAIYEPLRMDWPALQLSSDEQLRSAATSAFVIIRSMSTSPSARGRMAVVEASAPGASSRLMAAAAAERDRLEREINRIESRAADAAADLQKLVDERDAIRERLTLLERLAPARASEQVSGAKGVLATPPSPPNGFLRGARIRTVAVHLLAASDAVDRPIHYAEWFALVERAGFGIAAQDPVAAFLTQLTRSPVVEKAEGPGLYRLDLSAPRELQQRLRDLQAELARLHDGQQTLEAIASVRERRTELTAALARTERALEEAISALGIDP